MAGQNGSAAAQWRIAPLKKPSGIVQLPDEKGQLTSYPVFSVLDLGAGKARVVLTLEEELAGDTALTYARSIEISQTQVSMVCPDLPSSVLEDLSPNQLMEIRRKALGYDAANPPKPEQETPPSASSSGSSPAEPGSSAAPRKRSKS